jgi:hypothetical protein
VLDLKVGKARLVRVELLRVVGRWRERKVNERRERAGEHAKTNLLQRRNDLLVHTLLVFELLVDSGEVGAESVNFGVLRLDFRLEFEDLGAELQTPFRLMSFIYQEE